MGLALGLELGLRRGRAWRVACGAWRVACGVWRLACGVWRLRISSSSSPVQYLRTSTAAGRSAACAVAAPRDVGTATR